MKKTRFLSHDGLSHCNNNWKKILIEQHDIKEGLIYGSNLRANYLIKNEDELKKMGINTSFLHSENYRSFGNNIHIQNIASQYSNQEEINLDDVLSEGGNDSFEQNGSDD